MDGTDEGQVPCDEDLTFPGLAAMVVDKGRLGKPDRQAVGGSQEPTLGRGSIS